MTPRSTTPLLLVLALIGAPGAAVAQNKKGQAKTSTTGLRMPEDGGPLPRADMPQGGVSRPWTTPTPEGPGREPMGHDSMSTGPEGPSSQPSSGPSSAPSSAPACPRCSGGEGGPCPCCSGKAEQPCAHCGHCAGEGGAGATHCASCPKGQENAGGFRTRWDGYLKVIAEVIENDPNSTFVGRNDGFRVGNARIGLTAAYDEHLSAYVSLEASVARAEELNQQNAELTVGPRDLYLAYSFSPQAALQIGRFKAPFDLGELEAEGRRVFVDAPLPSRGVQPTQGFQVSGLRPGRQIGVMLARDRIGLSPDGFDVGYALALTNGRTESFALNDNDRPAGYARLSFHYGQYLSLNVAGFTDTRTVGELPNVFDEESKGAEASLQLSFSDLRIEAQGLLVRTDFPTSGAPHVNAYGVHAQWSYRLWDFEAAYRFAWYDPNHRFEVDAVVEHTLGVSYYPSALPLRFTLNGTVAQEDRTRALENNRLALLTQFTF